MKKSSREYKVLPFETPQGAVPAHEVITYRPDWMKSPIHSIVFETFSKQAEMPLEVLVHWTRFTPYTKKMWPGGGVIKAIICEDGQRIHVSPRSACHRSEESYLAAPIICRDTFWLLTLGGETLFEIKGVGSWLGSDRSEAATAKYLPCPYTRDNQKG